MLKKVVLAVGMVVVAAALVYTGVTFAQDETPTPQPGYGPGMMGGGYGPGAGRQGGGRGMMGGNGTYGPGVPGAMHEPMFDALAEGLGIDREELDSRVADGETPLEIALSLGFTEEEFYQIHTDARTAAINQLVADGLLTQEQADWMLSHMGSGYGPGSGFGPGNCPHFNGATGTVNG